MTADSSLPEDLIGPGATPEDLGVTEKAAEQAEPVLTPEEQEQRTKTLEEKATRIADAQGVLSTDKAALMKEMQGLSPSEAAELERIYGEQNKDLFGNPASLREDLQGEMEGTNESAFIDAALAGDHKAADELGVKAAASIIAEENDAFFNTDEDQVNELLRMHGSDPASAKELSAEYERQHPGQKLDDAVKANMNEAEFKEAKANLEGDRAAANVAVLEQGDAERSEEVIADAAKTPGGLEKLAADTKEATGAPLDKVLAENGASAASQQEVVDEVKTADTKANEERKQRLADDLKTMTPEKKAESQKKAKEVASKLSTELSKTHLIGNNFDVTDQLRGLSPAEVEMVKAEYAEQAKSRGASADLEADLRSGLEGKDLKVAEAALSGDKAKTAAALVEQAADGIGTDTERWKKAMETLETKEDREKFKKILDEQHGGEGGSAYTEMVTSETSSFDRDELNAMGIEDAKKREAHMAAATVSKNAYGGKYATIVEGITDSVTEHLDVSEEDRARGRAASRESFLMQLSNAGGDEDAQLDAVEKVAGDAETRKLFDEAMKAANGKSAAETLNDELHDPLSDIHIGGDPLVTNHRAEAAKELLAGNVEDAQAHRMLAHLDNYVNDNEDAATKMLESMPDKAKRDRVLEKANKLAEKDGDGSVTEILADELSPAELAVANARKETGKVDEITQLYAAGDTIAGLGKDTEKFYTSLQDKTPAQLRDMKSKFETAHPGENFEEWVKSKATSDGEARDFKIMLEGNYANMTAEERKKEGITDQMLIQRMKDLNAAGRDGANDREFDPLGNIKREIGNDIGNYMGDSMSNAGDRMNDRMAVALEMEKKLASGQPLSEEDQQRLVQNMDYMAGDQKAFTQTKTEVVNKTAEAAAVAVQVGVTAVSGSDDLGEVAGGLAKMEVKGTLNSGRYSADEMIADGTEIAASAIGSGLGGKFDNIPGASSVIEGGIGGVGTSVGDTKNWRDAGNMAESGIKNVSEGVVTAAVSEGIEGGFGDAAKDGIVSKATQAIAETAITGDHSKGIGELAQDTAVSALTDYATSKASGHHKNRTDAAAAAARPAPSPSPSSADSGEVDVATPEQKEARATTATQQAADADAARRAEAKRVLDALDAADQPSSAESGEVDVATPEQKRAREAIGAEQAADAEAARQAEAKRVLDGLDAADQPAAPVPQAADKDRPPATPIDIGPDTKPPEAPSIFGDEATAYGNRRIDAQTEKGPVRADVKNDKLDLRCPPGLDPAQQAAHARDAAKKLGLDVSDAAIQKALEGHPKDDSPIRIEQTLHVKDAATVADTARDILFAPEAIEARGDRAAGLCTVETVKLQNKLAAQGIFAPVMNGRGHRYIVVGDQIICPTFKQMGGTEPFVGTYADMVQKLAEQGDANPAKTIEDGYGILPPKDGQIVFADDVKPFAGDTAGTPIKPADVDAARRLMAEQAAAGIPPGQGLPAEMVDAVRKEQPATTPPASATPHATEGERTSIDDTPMIENDPEISVEPWDPGMGSEGVPIDQDHVPGPGERVNWGGNNGGIGLPSHEHLAAGTKLHRKGPPKGGYLSPEGTPIGERSLPPIYGADGKPLDYSPEEYFYDVGPSGLDVEANAIAPLFNQEGGGLQYQAIKDNPSDKWPPNVQKLVDEGRLIEAQQNLVREATEAERDEVMQALAEHDLETG